MNRALHQVDLHPEELLDRARRGLLTYDESLRIQRHVAACSACSLELACMADGMHSSAPDAYDEQLGAQAVEALFGLGSAALTVPVPKRARRGLAVGLASAIALGVLTTGSVAAAAVLAPGGVDWMLHKLEPVTSVLFAPSKPAQHEHDQHKHAKPRSHVRTPEPTASATPIASSMTSGAPQPLPPALDALPAGTVIAPIIPLPPALRPATPLPSPTAVTSTTQARRMAVLAMSSPEQRANTILAAAARARAHNDYAAALALYRKLTSELPDTRAEIVSRVSLAELELRVGHDAQAALSAYDRYLASGANALLAPEALAGRARCLERLGRTDEARATWQRLSRSYPSSLQARFAQRRGSGRSE